MTYEEFLEQDFDWTINSIDHQFYNLTIQEAIDKAREYLLIGKRVTDSNIRRYAEESLDQEEEKPIEAPGTPHSLPHNKAIPKRHQGKCYKKYTFTLEDISRLTNRKISTIRKDISLKHLDLDNLEDLIKYIKEYTV